MEHHLNGIDQQAMLDRFDSGIERIFGVFGKDGDALAEKNWAGIDIGRDAMDGHAGVWQAVCQGVAHSVHPAEDRPIGWIEQGGMHVDGRAATAIEEIRRQDEHPAGKDEQVGLERRQQVKQTLLQVRPCPRVAAAGEGQSKCRNPGGPRSPQRAGVWIVADHGHDLNIEVAYPTGIDQRLQIAAVARSEDGDARLRAVPSQRDPFLMAIPVAQGFSPSRLPIE